MSGYYGPSGSYLYDSEEYVTLTKAARDALASRIQELEDALEVAREALDLIADAHDGHERYCAIDLPHQECDCELGLLEDALAALAAEEPKP